MSLPRHLDVQIRLWPWSTEADEVICPDDQRAIPYYGSPVLMVSHDTKVYLPRRSEQFVCHGAPFCSLSGNNVVQYQLFEMPHGILASAQNAALQNGYFQIFSQQKTREIPFKTEYALPPSFDGKDSPLNQVVKAWSQFFDECLEKGDKAEQCLPWETLCPLLAALSEERNEPRMALIVSIAEKMQLRLRAIVLAARKILQRERQLMPVERITEIDTACLRWYIRQPGETTAQKAAMHRQSLLAIKREETYNTLENRVLKDFILRCSHVAQQYRAVQVDNRFRNSLRAKKVWHFENLCKILLQDKNLQGVGKIQSRVKPNYVLQNDARYREIWEYYQRLLRQDDEKDRMWDWQTRTWGDMARLLICATFSFFATPICHSSLYIHKEQILGNRYVAGSEPGPFALRSKDKGQMDWILEIVHSSQAHKHRDTDCLSRMGAHLYLVLQEIGTGRHHVVVIWATHTAASSSIPNWESVSRSAQRALEKHSSIVGENQRSFPSLSGLVMADSLDLEEMDIFCPPKGLPVFVLPADPRFWSKQLGIMATFLQDHLWEQIQ